MPKSLIYITGELAKSVGGRFPDNKVVQEVVAGLVFAKVVCPVIVSPEKFDLVKLGTSAVPRFGSLA